MNFNLLHILSSKRATIVSLTAYVILMAIATVIEKFYGTPVAKAIFYYSPLFIFLQAFMVINFLAITRKYRLISSRKWSYMAIHLALIVILTGALVTHFTGKEGMMHLREGERSAQMLLKQGESQVPYRLPFELELKDFRLVRYPGSKSPSSYESNLIIYRNGEKREQKVYMNNVLDLDGYRFYQASYDQDELGTILSVNYDAAGRTVTYLGYILLFAGLGLMLFDPHSRFRKLWTRLGNKSLLLAVLMLVPLGGLKAENMVIDRRHAARFAELPMQSANGRIIPVNTFASEIVRKFKAGKILSHLTPEQFLLSVMAYPADWSVIPIIEVKDKQVAAHFGWKKGRIAYRDAFDSNGYYKLGNSIEEIYLKNPADRNRYDKELLKIDDRVNIFHELLNNRLLRIFPDAKDTLNHRWTAAGEKELTDSASQVVNLSLRYIRSVAQAGLKGGWEKSDEALKAIKDYQKQNAGTVMLDENRIRTEVYYNQLNLPKVCRISYLLLGMVMIFASFMVHHENRTEGWKRIVKLALSMGVMLAFVLHSAALGMRWYISGYAPWSNSYETMVALAWAGVMCGFIFMRKNYLVAALATLFGGIVLFVSGLNWMDPQITPLVPVLKSPWLMAHVASLVMAYGFLGICCMTGTAYLYVSLSKKQSMKALMDQMSLINELSMILGTGLLAVGIFLGAVWANESWGRYWSWDPKETWALITMVVYSIVLHLRWFCKGNTDWMFNLLSQLSFLSILMTFLGVNYFLSGMHSYGSHDALASVPVWAYLAFVLFFVVPGVLSSVARRKKDAGCR